MSKRELYRETLRTLDDWDTYLMKESGLPGPRGNLELAQAAADEGRREQFEHWLTYDAERAPVNSPAEFLAFCGVVGLGKLLAEGQARFWPTLRRCASDPRWRTREGVAMALQRLGDVDMEALIVAMRDWSQGNLLEKRAAAAALCEPRLLADPRQVKRVLQILSDITASILKLEDRKAEALVVLRKGLGYGWSVAVAANPDAGKPAMEKWLACPDKDVRWIMKENLKKDRLRRVDAAWVQKWSAQLEKAK
jgi:hypothetical protein